MEDPLDPDEPDLEIREIRRENSSMTRLPEKNQLNGLNWPTWRDQIGRMMQLCGADVYVYGLIPRPNPKVDRALSRLWSTNDRYTQVLITQNIEASQMIHVSRSKTSNQMWKSLQSIYETQDHQTAVTMLRSMFAMRAAEGDDIPEHLTKIKKLWEHLNMIRSRNFHIPDNQFKAVITSSLPMTWDNFMEPYIGGDPDIPKTAKERMGSQQFIGVLMEEYNCRKDRQGTNQVYNANATS